MTRDSKYKSMLEGVVFKNCRIRTDIYYKAMEQFNKKYSGNPEGLLRVRVDNKPTQDST